MNAPKYPEHAKMRTIAERSQTAGEVLDWLAAEGWHRMRWGTLTDTRPCPVIFCDEGLLNRGSHNERTCGRCEGRGLVDVAVETWIEDRRSITVLLAEFFEIDLDRIETEKRAMLEALQ